MTGLLWPNAELAVQAWIAAYTDIPAGQIASTLPDPAKWTDSGFLQVSGTLGGPINPDLPEARTTIVQLDGWATRTVRDVFRPLWGEAMQLLERVRAGTFRGLQAYGRPLALPVAGYQPVRALSAWLVTEPRKVDNDPSGYARVTADLAITWTV